MVELIFTNHKKGQVAFEFIVVLAVVLFLSASIMLDFFNESNMSMMVGFTKNLVETKIGVNSMENKACADAYLESFEITEDSMIATVRSEDRACIPKDGEIAQEVEKTLCNGKANNNNVIECGAKNYILVIDWKGLQ